MNWWLAKAKHIDEVEDMAKEFKYRFRCFASTCGKSSLYGENRDSDYKGQGKLYFHTGKTS